MKNLLGKTFGRWTVLKNMGKNPASNREGLCWLCVCECGNQKIVPSESLIRGDSKSCGCLKRDLLIARYNNRERFRFKELHKNGVGVYYAMLGRCKNPTNREFKNYGGRGITVCDRWRESFENFLEDMGDPPPGLQLERSDNDGPYSPENCRWATVLEQGQNRRTNKNFEWNGRRMTITDIARHEGVAYCSLRNMLMDDGLSVEDSLALCRTRGLTFKERSKTVLYSPDLVRHVWPKTSSSKQSSDLPE